MKKRQMQETEKEVKSKKQRYSDILNSKGLKLLDILKGLRTEIAREEGMPPYIIFSDKTLFDMCVKLPQNDQEMLQVLGVGENKLEKYGRRFIEKIESYLEGKKEKLYFGELEETVIPNYQKKKKEKVEFYLTEEQVKNFPYQEAYLVTKIAEALNEMIDKENVKKISGAEIFRKLQSEGYADEVYSNNRRKKIVTRKGEESGLCIAKRMSQKGTEYDDIYYNKEAQKMILEWYVR